MALAVLWVIGYSPWSIRAKLGLRAQGVAFEQRPFLPTLSEPTLRWRLRRPWARITLPVLFPADGAAAIDDSLDIVTWGAARSEAPLVDDDLRPEILRWNTLSSRLLEAGRARTTRRVISDPVALTESLPAPVRRLGPLGRAIGRDAGKRLLRKYQAGEADVAQQVLVEGLAELETALVDRQWLLDRFSYADITAAVGLSFVSPHASAPLGPRSRALWTEADLATSHRGLLAWRDRVYLRALQ